MNFKKGFLLLLVGVGMVGNGICQNTNSESMKQRIKESQKIPVPLPPTTPFDSDSKAKAVYLEQYQAAYRNIMADLELNLDIKRFIKQKGFKELIFNAYCQGWDDGIVKSLKDHPEKYKVFPTIYINDFKKLPNSDTGLYIDSSKAGVDIQH